MATTPSAKPNKRTFFPPKTFDDDLDAFAQLVGAQGWAFSGVDTEKLVSDAQVQRNERAHYDALALEFSRVREAFGVEQEARYQRFAAALNAARGAFRRDKTVLAQLARFRRSARRAVQSEG